MKILKVLMEHRSLSLDTSFSYLANDETKVDVGYRVFVSFGVQKIIGLVIEVEKTSLNLKEISNRDGFQYKFIEQVIDESPIIEDDLLKLAKEMSYQYVTPLMSCIQTILPTAYKPQSTSLHQKTKGRIVKKLIPVFDLDSSLLTKRQKQVYQEICLSPATYLKDFKNHSIIKKLNQLGFLKIQDEEIKNDYLNAYSASFQKSTLNEEQQKAYQTIIDSQKRVLLLQGVTGSGKTEVYLHLVDYYLKKGKTAIILVPEIALTPMIIERFQSWFSSIAVLHGNLTPSEKKLQYDKIKNKEAKVVIGARSAIFAPLTNLGLIILDEEQSTSYKQDSMPTYHAREIAILRANQWNCKVLLGSATPSFESKARALKGVYGYVSLCTARAAQRHETLAAKRSRAYAGGSCRCRSIWRTVDIGYPPISPWTAWVDCWHDGFWQK